MPYNLNVVLIEPEIPQNTGTIGRMCLGINATLHLVKPMAFELTESRLKRAGLDYWEHLQLRIHESLEELMAAIPVEAEFVLVETHAGRTIYEHKFKPGTWILFGRETSGMPAWLLNRYSAQTLRIPMFDARIRSLNLSNAVSIVAYEAIRQCQTQ